MSDKSSVGTRDTIEIESYHLRKGDKLLDTSQGFKGNHLPISSQESGDIKMPRDENNSYSQGYSFPLRFVWFHFLSMVKKLKQVELSGRKIQVDDLPTLEDHVKVEYTSQKLKKQIEQLDPEKVTSLQFLKMLGLTFKKSVSGILIYIFFENITKLLTPYCMQMLIQLVKEGDIKQAFLWVFLLIATNFLGTTFGQNSWTKAQRLSAMLRLGLINILYEKVSNLSAYSVKKANVGKIINMISSDFSSFESKSVTIFHSILAPVTLTISCAMLAYRIGYIAILAIILMLGLFPLQKKIAQRAAEYTKLYSKQSDQKIKIFSEMMDGIRIIKMYGWEKAFNSIINKFRSQEVKYTLINQTIMYIEHAFSLNGPLFVALFCFLFLDMTQDNYLNTAIIFSTIELINIISNTIMKNVGYGLSFVFEFKVLVQRFMSIVSIENVQMKSIDNPHLRPTLANNPPSADTLLYMKDFSAYWQTEDLDDKTPVLSNINFQIQKGETVSIIGQIGSGKTSLLFAIMQEIPRYRGTYYSACNLSFAEQEPYILQGTVRDNILFGKKYDEKFYQAVTKACCLLDDFKQFAKGDQTIVGERGSNLSGGQKARICLARAVYADTDLYLLDDPLSAVDSKVAKKIFRNVINGLLKDKGVILVTHQLNYALRCQRIAVFDNGSIVLQGNPKEINFQQTSLAKYIETSHTEEEHGQADASMEILLSEIEQEEEENDEVDSPVRSSNIDGTSTNFESNRSSLIKVQQAEAENTNSTIMSDSGKKEDEYPVTKNTYINYFMVNPSPWIFLLVIFTFIIQEFLFTSFYKSLSLYEYEFNREQFYAVSFGILTAYFVFKFIQNSFMSYFILSSNQSLTQKMITSISQAKPILFDEIPSGQIINKFSTDISILDKNLPETAFQTVEGILHFINLIGSVIFINNFFIIPGVIEVYFFYKWFKYIKPILMRAKQLDLENKTPVFQFFQSSLNGVLIINVYGQKQLFQKKMATLMNNSIRTADIFWFVSRLFSVYMQYMALLTSAIGIAIVLAFSDSDHSKFAQSLTFFLLLTNFLHITLRAVINMDTFMTSSERAHSIIDLPKENIDLADIEGDLSHHDSQTLQRSNSQTQRRKSYSKISSEQSQVSIEIEDFNSESLNKSSITHQNNNHNGWPYKGELVFDNVYMRYKEGQDPVLKGVKFEAKPLERVAIVGRTGAGKSSIIQALFRMSEIDISSNEGISRILYDEQNTKNIGLHQLRRSISIIPQNPFVFSGSIRRNIDPLEEYSDKDINHVLRETGLNELMSKLPQGINTDMSDSTSVFSMGQRQLVCLARVMLRRNKLMVLDEATANVDMETDQKIQSLIKEKFKDTTIITIAHRLNTIADYDKIIVLDAGKVIEVDSPFRLLANNEEDDTITNTTSAFSQMVQHTGPKNAEQIFEISKNSYLEKKKDV